MNFYFFYLSISFYYYHYFPKKKAFFGLVSTRHLAFLCVCVCVERIQKGTGQSGRHPVARFFFFLLSLKDKKRERERDENRGDWEGAVKEEGL